MTAASSMRIKMRTDLTLVRKTTKTVKAERRARVSKSENVRPRMTRG